MENKKNQNKIPRLNKRIAPNQIKRMAAIQASQDPIINNKAKMHNQRVQTEQVHNHSLLVVVVKVVSQTVELVVGQVVQQVVVQVVEQVVGQVVGLVVEQAVGSQLEVLRHRVKDHHQEGAD